MQISKIKLRNFLHFDKELTLDLTYPADFPIKEKAGRPLDRVCLIGQSGTGKTSILNLIKCFTAEEFPVDSSSIDLTKYQNGAVEVHYTVGDEHFYKTRSEPGDFQYCKDEAIQKREYKEHIKTLLSESQPWLISFPFNVIPTEHFQRGVISVNKEKGELIRLNRDSKVWDLNIADIETISDLVFAEIDDFVDRYNDFRDDVWDEYEDESVASSVREKRKTWEAENINPLQSIAQSFLNDILSKFELEVETNPRFYKKKRNAKRDIHDFIILKQNNDRVDYKFLSTGTKQLILTILPLFFLKPKKSIILFDQPEASLYPDIQLKIPNIYERVAKENQFFFATHSPIVAAAFDPWEIIELKFDGGKVCQEKYYDVDKGRTIDSFKFNPKYLRWDSILTRVFDLQSDGRNERTELLKQIAFLEEELRLFDKEDRSEIKTKKVEEFKLLAKKLMWKIGSNT